MKKNKTTTLRLEEHDHPLDGGLNKVLCQVLAVVCVVPSLDPDRCLFFWVCWRVAQRLSPPFFFLLSFFLFSIALHSSILPSFSTNLPPQSSSSSFYFALYKKPPLSPFVKPLSWHQQTQTKHQNFLLFVFFSFTVCLRTPWSHLHPITTLTSSWKTALTLR